MLSTDQLIIYTGTISTTITLLAPATAGSGKIVTIKDGGGGIATTYQITVTTPSGVIDSSSSSTYIASAYGSIKLISNGTNWYIIDGKSCTYGKASYDAASNQSLATGTGLLISYGTQNFVSGIFSDANYFTVASNFWKNVSGHTQVWAICASVRFTSGAAMNNFNLVITTNTSAVFSGTLLSEFEIPMNAGTIPAATLGAILTIPSGTGIIVELYQDSGSTLAINSAGHYTNLTITQLS